jgi:arginase
MFRAGLLQLRQNGVGQVASKGLAWLGREATDGLWLHVDVDVLNDEIMPAVDSRQPDGLSWIEFHELLVTVLASGIAINMQVTILDPDLDPNRKHAEALTAALVQAFHEARIRPV